MKKKQQVSVINIEVGNRVEGHRKKIGYSQLELASGMNLTRTSIVNIEQGRQSLTVENLLKACAILKCKPQDLLPPTPKMVAKKLSRVKKIVHEKLLDVNFKW